MDIQDTKQVWTAWTNTDCTAGRGQRIPKAVCETEATAIRLGRGGSVQGSNCEVTEATAVKINNQWLAPARIHSGNDGDARVQEQIDRKSAATEKARAAGLTDDDLKALGSNQ